MIEIDSFIQYAVSRMKGTYWEILDGSNQFVFGDNNFRKWNALQISILIICHLHQMLHSCRMNLTRYY